jgi:hypothetical protein
MARNGLEEKLESITRQFVVQIVSAIRGASFAEVAELQVPGAPRAQRVSTRSTATRVSASPAAVPSSPAKSAGPGRPRQTADRRAELADKLVQTLGRAAEPMGVRTLATELGVAPDLLAVPLRELRASGKIAKHGEKRATTYSMA